MKSERTPRSEGGPGAGALRRAAVLVLGVAFLGGCDGCEEEPDAASDTPSRACDAPAYGHPAIAALYAIEVDGEPAILSADTSAVTAISRRLSAALGRIEAIAPDALAPATRIVVQGDLWGAAARLDDAGVSSPESRALTEALLGAMSHLALDTDGRAESHAAPPIATRVLSPAEGWREVDTEHSVLTHERFFGLRRVFRLFVRGDHEARALVSQLLALDAEGTAYPSVVVGEIELLELDDDGPTRARVLHLDRAALACGELALREETEVHLIPSLGADDFLLRLNAPEPLSTMPCARCHEDRDAFSLPTDRTSVNDRLGRLISQSERSARSIGLVPTAPPSAQ